FDRQVVDVAEPLAARDVELGGADLVEELFDHRADAHDLGGLVDRLAARRAALTLRVGYDQLAALGFGGGWRLRIRHLRHPSVSVPVSLWCRGAARASRPR